MFTVGPSFYKSGPTGDPFFSYVTLLLHCDGISGARDYIDSSSYNRTLTETGSNSLSNVRVKFGTASAFFNDGGIQVPDSASMELGSSQWCIEWWVYPTSYGPGILCKYFSATPPSPVPIAINCTGGPGTERIRIRLSSDGITYGFDQTFPSSGGGAYTINTWTHMAVTFDGTTLRAFSNGVLIGSAACSTTVQNTTNEWQIGRDKSTGTYVNGNLDDIRVTIGVPRYIANFTPPAAAFPNF